MPSIVTYSASWPAADGGALSSVVLVILLTDGGGMEVNPTSSPETAVCVGGIDPDFIDVIP